MVGRPTARAPLEVRDPGLMRTVASLAPASLLLQLLSFISSIVLATRLGATTATDAYYLALSVPVVAYGILTAAVRLGAIPALTRIAQTRSAEEFKLAGEELICAWLVAASVLSVVLTATMLVVLPAVAGASGTLAAATREYMVELVPYAVTGAILGTLGAVLAVRGRFVATTLVMVCEPLLKSVLVLTLGGTLGVQTLVLGNLVGNLVAIIVLWHVLARDGIRLTFTRFRRTPFVRGVLMLSAPLLVSQSVLQLNPLIDRAAAAGLGRGSVTEFEMGARLFAGPTALLTGVIVAPLAGSWARRLGSEGWEAVVASLGRVVKAVVLIVPPLVVIGYFLRLDLVSIAYHSRLYGPTAVANTADVLGLLLLGLVPQILIVPLSTLFIIRGDAILPLKIGMANFALNAALDVLLRRHFGVGGIAFSTTATLTILYLVYATQARRRWGPLHLAGVARPLAVSLASCIAIAVVCRLPLGLPTAPRSRTDGLVVALLALAAATVLHFGFLRLAGFIRAPGLPSPGRGRWRIAPPAGIVNRRHGRRRS